MIKSPYVSSASISSTERLIIVLDYVGTIPNKIEQQRILDSVSRLCPTGVKTPIEMTVYNSDDVKKLIIQSIVKNNTDNKQTYPEAAAAKIIGSVLEKQLNSNNAAVITLAINAALVEHLKSTGDASKAFRNAITVLSKKEALIKIPLELRDKYHITKEVLNIIHDIAVVHNLC